MYGMSNVRTVALTNVALPDVAHMVTYSVSVATLPSQPDKVVGTMQEHTVFAVDLPDQAVYHRHKKKERYRIQAGYSLMNQGNTARCTYVQEQMLSLKTL
jgi:hypothetical protein